MFQRDCRCSKASRYYGGGGGGTDINQMPGGFRNFGNESKDLGQGYNFQTGQYQNYVQNDPLLKPAQQGVLGFFNQLPGMIGNLQGAAGTATSGLTGLQPNYDKFLGPTSALSAAYGGPGGIGSVLASHGALSKDATNAAIQQGRITGEQTGTTQDPSSIISDYVSRKSATDANFNQALGQSQSALGQQAGAVAGKSGLIGQIQNIASALPGQIQGLQTGATNQLLGVGNAAVSQAGAVFNPILSYIGNLFGGNQQAAIAQAQVNAQQQAAGKSGTAGAVSGIGSVIGGVAAAY